MSYVGWNQLRNWNLKDRQRPGPMNNVQLWVSGACERHDDDFEALLRIHTVFTISAGFSQGSRRVTDVSRVWVCHADVNRHIVLSEVLSEDVVCCSFLL
jgi:hypothetical protein